MADLLFNAVIELSTLDGTTGFRVDGVASNDDVGYSVASAGDVNGDGIDDMIIASPRADPTASNSGAVYIVFGRADGDFAANFSVASLDGTNGFRINGVAADDKAGFSVSSAGDINNDGIDDLLIGARHSDANGSDSGSAYVVFGRDADAGATFAASLNLSSLDGTTGFKINGVAAGDYVGTAVAAAGDINGDGIDDLILGTHAVDTNGFNAGAGYVVFGKSTAFASTLELSALTGTNGFKINGALAYDYAGFSVASAGDVNDDGVDDLIIGAFGADPNALFAGASYVVFGKTTSFAASIELSGINGSNGFKISG
jgi:hypothetical protein